MDGTLGSAVLDGETLTFTYDGLKRLSSRITLRLQTVYSYKNVGTKTTTQIAGVSYKNAAGTANILPADGYTYDVMGNITKVTSGTTVISQYEYDNQNQLVSEVRNGGYEDSYVYDTYGNIRSIARENPGAGVSNTYTFTYSTEDWKDQLVGVTYKDDSGQTVSGTLTYDNMGNPLTYFNGHNSWNFTWKYGKQLASATDGTNTITNTYDAWGNVVGSVYEKTEGLSNTLYEYNALKYRGYYYDADLELYYLNTRYYDPVICRFISADDISVLSVNQDSFLQYNLYTYCLNNPVNSMDSSGRFPWMFLAKVAIGAAISAISYAISSFTSGEKTIDPLITCEHFIIGAFNSAICGIAGETFTGTEKWIGDLASAVVSGVCNMATTIRSEGDGVDAGGATFGMSIITSFIPENVFGVLGDVGELANEVIVGTASEVTVSALTSYKSSVNKPSSSYLGGSKNISCRAPEHKTLCERRAEVLASGGVW